MKICGIWGVFWLNPTGSNGLGFRVWGSGFRVLGSGFRVQGLGFRVWGSGFRVWAANQSRRDFNLPAMDVLQRGSLRRRIFISKDLKYELSKIFFKDNACTLDI